MSVRRTRANRHLKGRTWERSGPCDLIVDTNVYLDILSIHDITREIDRHHTAMGDAAVDEPQVVYRIKRARESFLFAWFLSQQKLHSYSPTEASQLIQQRVPPSSGSFEVGFITVSLFFIGDYLIPGFASRNKSHVNSARTGDRVDKWLVMRAKNKRVPIVTNEGNTPGGLTKKNTRTNMRARCEAAGVSVMTPAEYYSGKLNEREAIEAFFARFDEQAPVYMREHGHGHDMNELLKVIWGAYELILLGKVPGRSVPLF